MNENVPMRKTWQLVVVRMGVRDENYSHTVITPVAPTSSMAVD